MKLIYLRSLQVCDHGNNIVTENLTRIYEKIIFLQHSEKVFNYTNGLHTTIL